MHEITRRSLVTGTAAVTHLHGTQLTVLCRQVCRQLIHAAVQHVSIPRRVVDAALVPSLLLLFCWPVPSPCELCMQGSYLRPQLSRCLLILQAGKVLQGRRLLHSICSRAEPCLQKTPMPSISTRFSASCAHLLSPSAL